MHYFRKGGGGERGKIKNNFVCVHVFTVPLVANVDLPLLYKAVS